MPIRSTPSIRAAAALAVLALASPSAGPAVSFTTLASGFDAPIAYLDPPDGLPHRLVAEQPGRILVWDGAAGTPGMVPFLDLRDDAAVPAAQRKVLFGGERGLLSMAAHPAYGTNGFVFVYYTSRDWDGTGGIASGDVVIERYTRDPANPETALAASAQLVLVIPHADDNHNGGELRFGPDGFLYVAVGDGGGGCDSTAHSGQDVDQLLGKVLRLDVDGADAFPADPLRNYAIPASNPLVGVAGRDEILALGLRNPFRMSFDRASGEVYVGDVGQDDWEEINRFAPAAVAAGAPVNFGWPCLEGFVASECADPPQGCGATFTPPVRVEANSGGSWNSIVGGYRYRGSRVAELVDRFVYGDASHDGIWAATVQATPGPPPGWPSVQVGNGHGGPYAFGEDQGGELYLLSGWNGTLVCLHAAGDDCRSWAAAGDIFLSGFEHGTAGWAVAP